MTRLPTTFLDALGAKSKSDLEQKIRAGEVGLSEIAKALYPNEEVPDVFTAPALPVELTDKQREAVDRLPEVFGSVVPESRRALSENELAAIHEERATLKILEALCEKRVQDIRTTVVNHMDVLLEEDGEPSYQRDKEGHYLLAQRVNVDDTDECFSWEVTNPDPQIDLSMLEELVASGQLDHQTYLSITTPTRVVDETKVLQQIAKNPSLLNALANATVQPKRIGSLNIRKQKHEC